MSVPPWPADAGPDGWAGDGDPGDGGGAATPSWQSVRVAIDDLSRVGEARRLMSAMARRCGFSESDEGRVALATTEVATNLARHGGGGVIVARFLTAVGEPSQPRRSSGRAPSGAVDREEAAAYGLELLALDRGAGMPDIPRALQDGYSTAGTAGQGLGAVRRLANAFDLHSVVGRGTAMVLRFWQSVSGSERARLVSARLPFRHGASVSPGDASRASGGGSRLLEGDFGVVCLPFAGETTCGDAWARFGTPGAPDERLVVVDGLGHGAPAAQAAAAALATAERCFKVQPTMSPDSMLREMHQALRATRGAAVAVVAFDDERRHLRYAGVGNIAGAVLHAEDSGGAGGAGPSPTHPARNAPLPDAAASRRSQPHRPRSPGHLHDERAGGTRGGRGARVSSLVSHNGIVGHTLRKVQEFAYPWEPGALLVIHSDGLGTQWRLDDEPGLATRDAALIAGVLYRDWARGRDDVTVIAVRCTSHGTNRADGSSREGDEHFPTGAE